MSPRRMSPRRTLQATLLAGLLTMTLVLTGCTRASAERPHVIRFVHVTAPATPKGQAADRFKRLAEERLPGRVKVEVYPSAQLMDDDDSMESLALGEIQMVATSLSKFDRMTKRFQVFDLPFLFDSLEDVEHFQSSPVGQELLKELEHVGFLGLGYWHNGMKQLGSSRHPLRLPEDAARMNFRIQESDVLEAQVRALNANPQKMAFSEVYHALQTGAVDAQENTWSNKFSQKFFEVQPYLTASEHGYLGYLFAVNAEFWHGLPEDVREVLTEVADEVTRWVNGRVAEINEQARQRIEESGRTTIIDLTDDERQAWRHAMRPVWDQFAADIGNDVLEAARGNGRPST